MFGWILRSFAVGVLFLVIHGAQSLLGVGLPWWGSLLAATAAYGACAFTMKALFFRAITAPFQAKGAVLRGAKLVVHSVQAVAAPSRAPRLVAAHAGGGDDDPEDECDECDPAEGVPAGWSWYSIDATVTPPALGEGPFTCWEPGDLRVVPFDADTSPKAPADDDSRITCKGIEVFEDGGFVKDEGMKYQGEKRLRMLVACEPGMASAKLRYYFEGFGKIDLG